MRAKQVLSLISFSVQFLFDIVESTDADDVANSDVDVTTSRRRRRRRHHRRRRLFLLRRRSPYRPCLSLYMCY